MSSLNRRLPLVAAAAFVGLLALGLLGGAVSAADPSASPAPGSSLAAASSSAPTSVPDASPSPGAAAAPCPLPKITAAPTLEPGASPTPATSPLPLNLCPAVPDGANPIALLAWLFTPVFQVIFMALALLYSLIGDIGLAIILVTILLRLLLVPLFRAQITSQRRMQMLQPEIKAIATKFKGNRAKISEEQMKLYKERGYNPAAGCLPALLPMAILLPMYQVFREGLTAPDISSMLQVFGHPIINVVCQAPGDATKSCINAVIPWLFNTDAGHPQVLFAIFGFGVSVLAIISSVLQLVQTRMMQAQTADPSQRSQQRIFMVLPLFSLIYGGILPAGLVLYWITTTVFAIVQQYLIVGFGGMFPLFGWTPRFATDHTPRFPIQPMKPRVGNGDKTVPGAQPGPRRSATDSAAGTIKPARTKARTSRRGRRR